jgi:hypothetical protein
MTDHHLRLMPGVGELCALIVQGGAALACLSFVAPDIPHDVCLNRDAAVAPLDRLAQRVEP